MYDRNRDFVSFDNSWKSYFDLPPQEVFGFFNPKDNAWMCEVVDHTSLNLKQLNTGVGTLYKMSSIKPNTEIDDVAEVLRQRYPNAIVVMYLDIDDWIDDKEEGRVS